MQNDITLELEPTAEVARHSEGSFVTLADGRLLFAWSAFYGGGADHAAARIDACTSGDGGRTWSAPTTIVANEGRQNVMSVSLLRLAGGAIALFYLVKNGWHDCRLHMRTSTDEAASWSEPRCIMAGPGYYVVNNDRVVQLATGRLIAPAAFCRLKKEGSDDWDSLDRHAVAIWFLSDDEGATWREAAAWRALPVDSTHGLQEPGVVELGDGRLFCWCRTVVGCQYGLWSEDGGEHWSMAEPTEFASPASPASMKRIPLTGDLLAVWNDASGRFRLPAPNMKASANRTPLATAISRDSARTWQRHKALEDSPVNGFCYTAIHFVDNAVLLAYCAGGPETKGVLNRLRIRRVEVDWFYA